MSASAGMAHAADTTVRFATFNASLNRNALGDLLFDMSSAQAASVDFSRAYASAADIAGLSTQQKELLQAHNVAEIIQRVDADVLLVNEFDFDSNGVAGTSSTPSAVDYSSTAAQRFQDNYLFVAHGGGTTGRQVANPITYAYRHTPSTNTGLASGFDLDNSGAVGGGNDAFGFGNFAGQFGFTIYSKFEIKGVRSFQNFLWKDMPGNLLTNDPTLGANNLANFYSADEMAVLRLSSKNHVDITLDVNGTEVHFLTAHPTPPVFDGAEDRNGKRNADEIRFWSDYVNGASYMYDDQGGTGGLASGSIFVIAGDYNADPNDGDAFQDPIEALLQNPLINVSVTPASQGGVDAATDPNNNGNANAGHLTPAQFDTADFSDAAPGNLRVDYVLPSANVDILGAGIFWPTEASPDRPLVGEFNQPALFAGLPSSDHKAVFVDVAIPAPVPVPPALPLLAVAVAGFGLARRRV
ncbi:MAG: endonuclease/exonuclease/phosphatase family protein [Gammaproteobacteria bacterium]|nr:endonuclease/exonuclease/phosphatase family protein [Gammaproteobacteria bacterium]